MRIILTTISGLSWSVKESSILTLKREHNTTLVTLVEDVPVYKVQQTPEEIHQLIETENSRLLKLFQDQ